MFLLTFLLNGGLDRMMLRCLFLRGCSVACGMYSSLWLKLLCPRAFDMFVLHRRILVCQMTALKCAC